ncbi:Glycine betaine/carnitine/choline transport system permease protein opuCB [Bacillus subtilis subsp. subtilis str. BSP1]|nr:Glycine betaine/carnitine/choline transport system permease protein opuCB [Bacillus subtilis subsp. subtilis str. BSP1]
MNQMMTFLQTNGGELLYKTGEHLYISLIAVVLGIIVAVPLGVALTRMKKGAGAVIGFVNIVQTLPSLAILAFFYSASRCRKSACDCRFIFLFGAADPAQYVYRH